MLTKPETIKKLPNNKFLSHNITNHTPMLKNNINVEYSITHYFRSLIH